jgi:hypothetical protein
LKNSARFSLQVLATAWFWQWRFGGFFGRPASPAKISGGSCGLSAAIGAIAQQKAVLQLMKLEQD